MLIDLKYHISSLAAVFLALGLGIIIGGALLGSDTLVQEQEKVISHLEKDFEQLRADRRILQEKFREKEAELDIFQRFNSEIIAHLVEGALVERKVAVVKTNNTIDPELAVELDKSLRWAGAEVTMAVSFLEWPDSVLIEDSLAGLLRIGPEKPTESLFSAIISEIAGERNNGLLYHLRDLNFVHLDEGKSDFVDSVIILGGSHEEKACRFPLLDLPLVKAAQEYGLTVIGVEPLNVEYSYVPFFKNIGLTTVDNINTLPGQTALIFLLATQQVGNFGVKSSAGSILPDLTNFFAR